MTRPSPISKVLEMVRAGRITKEQGDELLTALQPAPHPLTRLLFTPFEQLSVGLSLGLGVAVAILSGALMLLRTHFDGVLDVHLVERHLSLGEILVEQVLVWPFMSAVLWGAALLSGRRGRFVDVLANTGVARTPMLLAGAGGWAVFRALSSFGSGALVKNAGVVAAGWAILCLAWFIALLYQGYRAASGGRGVRAVVSFILAVVLAEVLAKLVLGALPLQS